MMEHHMKSFLLLLFLFGSIASLPLPAILEAYNGEYAVIKRCVNPLVLGTPHRFKGTVG